MNMQQGPEILFWLKFAAVFLLPITVEAYFCGCFNGAVIVSKYILRDDVRNHGSGNAGLTNFYRAFGGPLTLAVILTDVLKAVVAVWLGMLWMGQLPNGDILAKYWAGLFCLLGHMFPCMFRFKGGKGILSGGTIAIMIDWVPAAGGADEIRVPGVPVGRGQFPVYHVVLLPLLADRGAGLYHRRIDRVAAPGQYQAAAQRHGK